MSDVVRVLRFLPATVAEGPGRRAAALEELLAGELKATHPTPAARRR
jgi:hypothetical protein